MSDIDIPVTWVSPESLIPYANNAKNHPKAQVKKIAASMKEFGFTSNKAIEVDSDMVVINGHGRRLASIEAKLDKVPVVIRADLTPLQVKAYRLIDNSTAESNYDTELMSAELIDLKSEDFDLLSHFDERDLDFLAGDDLGEMDLSELGANVAEEADEYSRSTEDVIEETDEKVVPVSKVLGFSTVTGSEKRKLALLMAHAESMTNLKGSAALSAFAVDYVGV